MKLISLNVWCGIKYELLKDFLERQLNEVDVFCFQEVRNGEYLEKNEGLNERANLYKDLEKILSGFTGYYTEMAKGVGIASFIRNNINIKKVKSSHILSAQETEHLKMSNGNSYFPRMAQSIYLKDRNLVIHNFHGIPGNEKKDTPERDLQTNRLLEMLNDNYSQIIVGDFNLNLNTQAILRLENRMENLIKTFNIKSTRNSNYSKFEIYPFADYIFLSEDISINTFQVLPDEASDHLALFLDFI